MFRTRVLFALPLAALFGLTVVSRAFAVAPEIKDEAKMFSAEAVKKANEQIKDIARKHHLDLLVETFTTVPGDQVAKVKDLPREERVKFFQTWAKDRMNHHVVNGVYVLICKEPPFVRVEVSDGTIARQRFGTAFGGEMGKMFLEEFREKRFDEGLLKAVKMTQDKLGETKTKPKK